MKRSMGGGSLRGPVAVGRQRRTIRFVQLLLVLVSGALMMFAGYSFGRISGFEDGSRSGEIDAPREPSVVQPIVLVALGTLAIGAAFMLQDGRSVRLPTPAKLEELTGRAEAVAIEKAEEIAQEQSSDTDTSTRQDRATQDV